MFIEFSFKKVLAIAGIIALLICAVTVFVLADGRFDLVNRIIDFTERSASNIKYTVLYKMPWQAHAAVRYSQSGTLPNAEAIPVLIYHGTPPEGNNNPPLPQNIFISQMRALKDDGWNTITLEQFEAFMQGKISLPPKSFLLTFDDGRKETFYPVDPVLKDLHYSAVMFVITGFSLPENSPKRSSYYLSKSELTYMAKSGRWEIESHGDQDHRLYDVPGATSTDGTLETLHDDHFLSNKFWLPDEKRVETTEEYTARITNDLAVSKKILEQDFGKPITAFAFPFNDYGQDTANFPDSINIIANAVKANYDYAFYQVDPYRNDPFNYPDPSAYMIKRIEPVASWNGEELVSIMDQSAPRTLPYQSGTFGFDWSSNWGSVTRSGSTLSLRATASTTGAAGLLNGSRLWKDYAFDATVDWNQGEYVSLIARYRSDSETFLSCAFSTSTMMLEAHDNGKQTIIASAPYDAPTSTEGFKISMQVKGKNASCSAYGVSVEDTLKTSYDHTGSLGLQIWDERLGVSSLDAQNISVHGI
jgi:peptidoglycan/xylan/chitin deacetylase (PgdA/CDA1 family)